MPNEKEDNANPENNEPEIPPTAPEVSAGDAMAKLMGDEGTPAPDGDQPETPPPAGDQAPPEKPTGEEAPPADAGTPTVAPTEPTPDQFDEEIDAIEPRPDASPKSIEALNILKQKAKAEHKAALEAERARKLAESQVQELQPKLVTPELEKEVEELRTFKQTFGLENDPNVTKEFDEKIASASSVFSGVMTAMAVPPATIKYIEDSGGLNSFRISGELMPATVTNPDGSRMTHSQFYKTYIEKNATEAQKEELADAFSEVRRVSRERSQAVQRLKENKDEYFKKQQETMEAAKEDWVKRVGEHSAKVLATYGDVATLKDIPPNATPEQKAQLEAHNQNYRNAEAKAREIMSQVTPENLTEAAIAAGYVDVLKGSLKTTQEQLTGVTKERDDLQRKLEELKNAGKTTDLRGTSATGGIKKGPNYRQTAEEAMAERLKQE